MPWHSQTRTLKLSHELSDELCFPPTHAVLLSPSAIMQESDPVLSDRASGSADEFVAEPQLADGVEALLKQQFFRLMSQEYRTSLSTILMSVDELEFDAIELDREEAELCHLQIRRAVEHMRHLLYEARENF